MVNLPRISIITPSLNKGPYLERTIRSVLDQGYPALEYVIVDGGSTDSTIELLKRYESRIRWVSEKDRGQSDAVNKGLAMISGEVCSFLNADDLLESGALWRVGEYFGVHPEACWLAGRCRIIDGEDREIRTLITAYKNFWLRFRSYPVLEVLNYISQPATFWRRSLHQEIGFFREDLFHVMDYDFWLRVGKKYPLHTLREYLASFRVYPDSKSGATTRPFEDMWQIIQSHCTSPFILGLHRMHSMVEITIYRRMIGRMGNGKKETTAESGK